MTEQQQSISRQWIERTLAAYPPETAHFLAETRDRFRNPVGHALRNGLPVLVEELFGDMDPARITPVLEEIVRIRAVQDFPTDAVAGFVLALKELAGADLHPRIDRLAVQASDLFERCRERMDEIRVKEASRRTWLRDRIASECRS